MTTGPRLTSRRGRTVAVAACAVFVVSACASGAGGDGADGEAAAGDPNAITVYSGRSENRVGDLFDRFQAETGIPLEVRYGDAPELVAQLSEEGDASPADVFFAQEAGGLGTLSEAGRLQPLPEEVTGTLDPRYVGPGGTWVATSARARVVGYDSRVLTPADLPQTLDDLLDPRWRGQIGFPPGSDSWTSFVTAVRLERGEEGARQWLRAFSAQQPPRFDSNHAVIDGIESGVIALGLINHYYIFEKMDEVGPQNLATRNHYVGADALGLVNVAGAGVLDTADDPAAAQQLVAYLASDVAQQFFADTSGEYPIRPGITSATYDMPALTELTQPDIALNELRSLEETLEMLEEEGLT